MNNSVVKGCVLGLALGDAFGAPYEGGMLERGLWSVIGKEKGKRRWTDDTQMTLDVVESLLQNGCVDQDDLARRFAKSYQWSRGYGPGAAKILKKIRRGQHWRSASVSVFADGSFGNGGAMRAPVLGLYFADEDEATIGQAAGGCAEVTHAHPFAKEGAALVALATALASQRQATPEILNRLSRYATSAEFAARLNTASSWLEAPENVSPATMARQLGNGIAAVDSCVTAVFLGLGHRHRPFSQMLDFAARAGGDVDTISAMAGAIWGAINGVEALPQASLAQLEDYGRLESLATQFAQAVRGRSRQPVLPGSFAN